MLNCIVSSNYILLIHHLIALKRAELHQDFFLFLFILSFYTSSAIPQVTFIYITHMPPYSKYTVQLSTISPFYLCYNHTFIH